jgi:hypothetical protein
LSSSFLGELFSSLKEFAFKVLKSLDKDTKLPCNIFNDLLFPSSLFKIESCANFQFTSLLFQKNSPVVSSKIGK